MVQDAPEGRGGREGTTRRRFWPFVILLPLLAACGGNGGTRPVEVHNSPPVIRQVFLDPSRVHAAQRITVSVAATDADGDQLHYRWSATRGRFNFGIILPSVPWDTAHELGLDTLTVLVTDAQDSVYRHVPVQLVLPAAPDSLHTINHSTLADLEWQPSVDQGIENWRGYEIYMGEESLAALPDSELTPYRITSTPITETHRRITGLVPGVRYYFHLRSLRLIDGVEERSPKSLEIDMSPRPDGILSGFRELANSAGGHALDFSSGVLRILDPDTSEVARNDLYLGTADALDQGGQLRLKGVSLLQNRNARWGDREVLIKQVGEDWDIRSTDEADWGTDARVELLVVYAVKIPEADSFHYAKMQVTQIGGFGSNRSIWIRWAYQTLPDYPSF
jgi:hypothetical protein